tara:strand:+ start:972 stop:1568 length:597 start_codon:yes stop_codon:yes gene_type:complete
MDKQSIIQLCEGYNISYYTINDDGSIDVDGDVSFINLGLTELPLKFNKVSGDFYCAHNNLTTLKGCPIEVGEIFNCNYNELTSLEYSPIKVGDDFCCTENNLTDLKGCPEKVGGVFLITDNNITDLKEFPKLVGGYTYLLSNPIGSISTSMDIDFVRAFNSYKVLKDGVINLKRLKYLMEQFDKPINIEEIKKHYEVR